MPAVPASTVAEGSILEEALSLLRCLNTSRDERGQALPSRVVVDGFEPWWFLQEHLFWHVLVPYVQHRTVIRRVLSDATSRDTVPKDVVELCRRVEIDLPRSRQQVDGSMLSGVSRNLKRLLSRLGFATLAGVSAIALVWFRIGRKDTVLYAIDKISPGLNHDFRISPVYRELRTRGYRFGEYVYTGGGWPALVNAARRRHPAVYLEALTATSAWITRRRTAAPCGAEGVTLRAGDDAAFLARVADKMLAWCHESAFKVRVLRQVLRLQRVRRAVILDDSRHGNELAAACRSLGIPTLGYMHGLLNRYHPGLMAYGFQSARRHAFDLYGLWSEYFRRRVLAGDLYTEDNTFVYGPLRLPSRAEIDAARSAPPTGHAVRVLLVYEPRAVQEDVLRYVQPLMRDGRFSIALRFRPGEDVPWLAHTLVTSGRNVRIIRGGSLYAALADVDVVVGTYSTVLYEAALVLRPAVVLNTTFTYGHEMAMDGLAEFAETPGDVAHRVLSAHAQPEAERIRRRNVIWGEKIVDGPSVLLDTAEERLWERPR